MSDKDEAVESSTFQQQVVVVSAPGKILLAGGYLVLDEANVGLVVAVDKRFYCECRITSTINNSNSDSNSNSSSNSSSTPTPRILVTVESPQFGATWKYQWIGNEERLVQLTATDEDRERQESNSTSSSSSNPFVEKSLRVALLYLHNSDNHRPTTAATAGPATTTTTMIHMKLAADNEFYSLVPHLQARYNNGPLLLLADWDTIRSLPQRLPAMRHPQTQQIYKTGLGSSACLVTVLTAALVRAYQSPPSLSPSISLYDPSSDHLATVSRLAQIGHCYAQHKVGSGFDVSAACFGSHVYRRFPAELLQELLMALDNNDNDNKPSSSTTATTKTTTTTTTRASALLRTLVDHTSWTGGVQSELHCFSASSSNNNKPSFLQCLMADVAGGSESPGMARQVLQWRQQQQQQHLSGHCPYWDDLAILNPKIVCLLQELDSITTTLTSDEQTQMQHELITVHPQDWSTLSACTPPVPHSNNRTHPVAALLAELRHTFLQCRHHLKAMGDAAGVPIEPAPQTDLCHAGMELSGVVAVLVPGAGGYDAVVCVYINLESVARAVTDFWAHWKGGRNTSSSCCSSDAATTTTTTTVCALTVQGAGFGDGVRIETEFPSLAVEEETPPK